MANFAKNVNCVIGKGNVLTKRWERIFAVCFGVTL